MKMPLAIALMSVVLTACASTSMLPDGVPVDTRDTSLGNVLTDDNGMTLYIFTKDGENKSNCYDNCAVNWPPLMAAIGAHDMGEFTVIERNDGTRQWAYDGKPLYLWKNDKAPGDVTGHEVGGVWYVINMDEDDDGMY